MPDPDMRQDRCQSCKGQRVRHCAAMIVLKSDCPVLIKGRGSQVRRQQQRLDIFPYRLVERQVLVEYSHHIEWLKRGIV